MRAIFVSSLSLTVLGSFLGAQADGLLPILRASAYVESFEHAFSSVVSEEHYKQELRWKPATVPTVNTDMPGGTAVQLPRVRETTLRSDFLLTHVPPRGWVPFRDVFDVNGQPVRAREDRLSSLFVTGVRDPGEQVRAILQESARFNVWAGRTMNVPTFALTFLHEAVRSHFTFAIGKLDNAAPGVVIEFAETARPTLIKTAEGDDYVISGRYWIDENAGTVFRTELRGRGVGVEDRVVVTYKWEPVVEMYVPTRMEEKYVYTKDRDNPTQELTGARRALAPEGTGVATYSKFRKFRVSTTEEFVPPK